MGIATITEWNMGKGPVTGPGAVSLTVDFDPQSLELTYTTTSSPSATTTSPSPVGGKAPVTWNKAPSQQTGQSASLAVTLLFDTTTSHGVSVQTKTDPLVLLTLPRDLGVMGAVRRVIQFRWGSFRFFGCVESMSQTIDFFSDTGVPLRSSVHLTIGQVGEPNQPSTPGGGPGGLGLSFGANVGIGAGASFGTSASAGASFGASASAGASLGASASGDASFGASASAGASLGASASGDASFGASASAGASFGASASGGASVSAGAGIGTTPLTLSQDGDTIQGISGRASGSVSWKAVAVANNIDNPRLLAPGTILSASAGAQLTASTG
jgi:hypothetical protein